MKKIKYNKDKLFFTSDPHFFHENIIKFCDRPFESVEEMNLALINNWNNKVPPDAHIFILGDLMLKGSIDMARHILGRLNGIKHIIWGNHDYQNKLNRPTITDMFESFGDIIEIIVDDEEISGDGQRVVMCHYPMLSWNGSVRGTWQLFGHIHSGPLSSSKEKDIRLTPAQYDVGVDNNNFTPLSYEEVKAIVTKQYLNK